MVLTRSQYKNMSKEELIQKLTDINSSFVNDINGKLTDLSKRFNEFTSKYDKVYSELQQCKYFNSSTLHEDVLVESICKALSLIWVNVVPEDLHACYRMKKSDRLIVKFKCRKQKQLLIYKRKNLGTKSQELTNLTFLVRLFVSTSMLHENQQLAYKCRQLKSFRKIHSTWFVNNFVNIKLTEDERIHKIFHVTDIENLLKINNLEEYNNNASF